MALALRIRVTWDDDVVQDGVFEGWRPVRVGAAGRAKVATPAVGEGDGAVPPPSIVFHRRPGGYRMDVPPSAAESMELAGEGPIAAGTLARGTQRMLGLGCGHLAVRGTEIDFEVMKLTRERPTLRMLVAMLGVAGLAAMAGFSYQLARQWGDGRTVRWGEPVALGEREASYLRVSLDNQGAGATRLQAGVGIAVNGVRKGLALSTEKEAEAKAVTAPVVAAPRKKPAHRKKHVVKIDPVEMAVRVALAPDPTPVTDESTTEDPDPKIGEAKDGPALLDQGAQALLAADLRSSINSLSAAEKEQPLDYENLNLLGLAHFFLGEHAAAAERWNQAVALDPSRSDAVNNLGLVAKRRGDLEGELAAYQRALDLKPGDCHALNSTALVLAKQGKLDDSLRTLAESDKACGEGYAYTSIQRAAILALQGKPAEAMKELELGLSRVDTMHPIKEYEVESDLLLDPAYATLRAAPGFAALTTKYLPRAVLVKDQILAAAATPASPSAGPSPAAVDVIPTRTRGFVDLEPVY